MFSAPSVSKRAKPLTRLEMDLFLLRDTTSSSTENGGVASRGIFICDREQTPYVFFSLLIALLCMLDCFVLTRGLRNDRH